MRKMPSMAQINALLTSESKTAPAVRNGRSANFPFWNAPIGTTTVVRILPDHDAENPFPWVEKRSIRLPFQGVVNSDYPTNNAVTVTVPCVETWGRKCPVTEAIRPLWKGSEEEKNLARKYYRKPSFIYSVLVVSSPFVEEDAPDSPVRIVALNKGVHENVLQGLSQPDFEEVPWDFFQGRDFKIVKAQQGQWANYSKSGFAFKPRALSDAEIAAIETHGLRNLADELGVEPDAETTAQIAQMYRESLAGEPFDAARYPNFRAYADRSAGFSQQVATAATGSQTHFAAGTPPSDILSSIRNRNRVVA